MKTKKRILYIDTIKGFGGSISSLAYLLWNIDERKYESVVIAGKKTDFWNDAPRKVPVIEISTDFVTKKQWATKLVESVGKKYGVLVRRAFSLLFSIIDIVFFILPFSIRLFLVARHLNIDLVQLNNLIYNNAGGIFLAKYLGVPCIAHHRGFEYHSPIARWFAGFVDHHIAISECIKQDLIELGVPGNKISIIPEGVDLTEYTPGGSTSAIQEEFGLSEDTPTFGLVAVFLAWKGHKVFLKAAKRVFEQFPESRAFVIGGGLVGADYFHNYHHEILELTKKLGIQKNVIFTGYRRNVHDFLNLLDVQVHSSILPEPFGRVIIEGMAMETPVISTKIGAPLEIIENGKTGILVEPNNPDELAEALLELLKHPERRKQIGAAAREEVENSYTIEEHVRCMELLYRNTFGEINEKNQ